MPFAVCVSSCVPHCAHRLKEAQARPVRGPEEVAQLLSVDLNHGDLDHEYAPRGVFRDSLKDLL